MTPTEQSVLKPSSTTGLSRALRASLRVKGTGAPRRAVLACSLTGVLAVIALLYVSAAPALAATPETPEAKPATLITATTATLHGVIYPHSKGGPGSFQFSYSPSETLECTGGPIAPVPPAFANGVEKEAVSTPVTELQPNREYAVCLTAFSLAAEPSEPSPPVAFKTLASKPEIASEAASGATSTTATLEAQVNPNNEETTFLFEFSKTEAAKKLTGTITTVKGETPLGGFGAQTATVPSLEKLLPGTTYFYRVVAENEQSKKEGKAVAGPVTSFTTLSTPTTEAATAVTSTTATFHGTLTPLTETPGAEAQYSFVYAQGSEDCTAGTATTPSGAGTGKGPQAVEAEATGLQPGATYSVCLVASNPFGSEVDPTAPQVSFTTLAGPPSIESESSSAVTPEGATLETTVNPNNQESTCSFEYSTDPSLSTGVTTVPCSQPLGAGGAPATGTATVTGLELHREYFFRAVAKNASGTTTDPTIEHFETETTVAPSLEREEATNITATTATLTAKLNPNGAQIKTCVFEYGTSTGYGLEAPCANPDATEAGAGRTLVPISAQLTELEGANVEYHWRLTVTSAAGATTSVDHTFVDDTEPATRPRSCGGQEQVRGETHSTKLPDCRAYELVTPPQKNGALIDSLFASGGPWGPLISNDGKGVMAPSVQCFAGAESCTAIREIEAAPYEFDRTAQGWQTHALAPPASQFGVTTTFGGDVNTHTTLFSGSNPPEDGNEHFYTRTGTAPPVAVGPLDETPGLPNGEAVKFLEVGLAPTAATSDFSHLLFQTTKVPGGHLWSLDGEAEEASGIYEYTGQNNSRPLAVAVTGPSNSTSLIGQCGSFIGSIERNSAPFGALSESGRTVYFSVKGLSHPICQGLAAPPTDELYARVDGEGADAHTVKISAPTPGSCQSAECKTSEPEDAYFEGASRDGSRVFFTSPQQLTDHASQGNGERASQAIESACARAPGSGCNLYESVCAEPCGAPGEEPGAKERELVDLSEPEGVTPPTEGPQVQGLMAISPDGSHVYFVARGKLAGNPGVTGAVAQEGQNNMYVYAEGAAHPLRFIATLPASDETQLKGVFTTVWTEGIPTANVTPNGRFLVFASHGALTSDDTRPDGPAQIYRYDAETGVMVRLSKGQDGFNDDGNAGSAEAEPGIVDAFKGWYRTAVPARANPTMSDDGQYVFFESPVALTPGALNEVKVSTPPGRALLAENVYEYHEGRVTLISDGQDTTPNSAAQGIGTSTRLYGTDPSGHDVFFATNDQLTSQDTDTDRDYYDARICEEGDPCVAPPATPQPCEESACQGAPPSPRTFGSPASATFNGPGNITPAPPALPLKPKPLTRAQTLARALKACRTKHNKHKRGECERAARKKFATKASKTSKSKK